MMQELVINIAIGLMIAVCFITIAAVFQGRKWKGSKKTDSTHQLKTYVKEFIYSDEPGKSFVELMREGAFCCMITGNHGGNFPEKKQRDNFKKFATPEICKEIMSLRVSNEEFII